ncbi:hypothetical protein ABPG75_008083 [Micractinium tetrahymenae]
MEGSACPKCGAEGSVDFDLVQGITACAACGTVLDEEQLVHAVFDEQGAPVGTMVRGDDTGEVAGAHALPDTGTGLAIQRSKRSGGEAKARDRVRQFCALLELQPAVVEQAVHLMGRAAPQLLHRWRRDLLAAAVTYAACRLNSLPLTLADLSGPCHIPACTLGRHYVTLCRLLGLQPPLLLAPHLLPRCLDRVTAQAVRGGVLTAAQVAALQRDASAMLDWMSTQMQRQAYPLAAVGTALVLAAEMNTISLRPDHVCATLGLHRCTLSRVLGEARTRLLQLAAFLPYSGAITLHNVGSHARTIMQLAALVGSTGSGQQQQQAQQGRQQQQTQQGQQPAALPGSAGAGSGGSQERGAGDGGAEGTSLRALPAAQEPRCEQQQGTGSGETGVHTAAAAAAAVPDAVG